MRTKHVFGLMAAVSAGVIGLSSAEAASIKTLMLQNPVFLLEDDSAELHVETDGDNILEVGETLRGVAEFPRLVNQVTNVSHNLDGIANNHLSAIFEAEVIAKTDLGGGLFRFEFGPTAGGAGTMIADHGLSAGTMIAFYEDNVDNTSFLGVLANLAAAEAGIVDGTLVLELGMGLDADEAWVAPNTLGDNTTAGAGFTTNQSLGNFNFQLSVISSALTAFRQQATNPLLDPFAVGAPGVADQLIDWTGSGQILGIDSPAPGVNPVTNIFDFTDDADLGAVAIPEPTTIGLLGAGLFGLGALAWQRRRARAARG